MDKDTFQSIAVNGATIGFSLTGVEAGLRVSALVIGIVFTLYKFHVTYKADAKSRNS